jgi:hypothetical protein
MGVSKNACSQGDPKNNGKNNNSNVTISCFSYIRYIWTLPYVVTYDKTTTSTHHCKHCVFVQAASEHESSVDG